MAHGWAVGDGSNPIWLVVWNIFFPYILGIIIIIPTDELIFFRGVGIPPTSYGFRYGNTSSASYFDQDDRLAADSLWIWGETKFSDVYQEPPHI